MLVLIIGLVVAASGCTSQTSDKSYSANGLTFTYPANWTDQNKTELQANLGNLGTILVAVGDSSNLFGIAKLNLTSSQTLASVNEWASNYNTTMKNSGSEYVSEKTLTIDGVPAYAMTMKDSGNYVTDIYFVKNNSGYIAVYVTTSNNLQTLEKVMNTLKIS